MRNRDGRRLSEEEYLMEQESQAARAAGRVADALKKTSEENRYLRTVLAPFAGLLMEQARWKAELPATEAGDAVAPDATRFGNGIPVTDRQSLICLGDLWKEAAERLVPPFAEGFAEVAEGLRRLQYAILKGGFDPDSYWSRALKNRDAAVPDEARAIGLEADVLQFALIQLAKPVVERRAESLQPLIKNLTWKKGYCPICGSLPELSLLKGKEGHRWLRCAFCAGEWRFHRTTCPNCESQKPDDIELCYVEGREHERVELCHNCMTYVVSVDVRILADQIVPEVTRLGLLHLDAIAQRREFRPMNPTGWTKSAPAGAAVDEASGRASAASGGTMLH